MDFLRLAILGSVTLTIAGIVGIKFSLTAVPFLKSAGRIDYAGAVFDSVPMSTIPR